MIRSLRSPAGRLLVAAATAAFAVVLLGEVARAAAGDGISATGASVDKVGWWHERNVATSTQAAIVTVPRPPSVPAGTLAVGAVNGSPDKITAIGILPDARVGDTVTSFTLTIKEADPPAVSGGDTTPAIVACPITSFWVGGENGTWDTRPAYDCTLAKAPGVRNEEGTWTFDLRSIGEAWLSPSGTIAADGIVLVEEVDAPHSFQTVFATSGEGALVVSFQYQPASPTTTFDDGGDGVDDFDDFDGGSGDFDPPSFGSSDIPVGGLPTPPTAGGSGDDGNDDAPRRVIAHRSPNVLGNLPGGLVVAVPAFLVLLGLLTYSLGPAGEPVAATRQRGVSRALSARARAGGVTASSSSPTSMETS